MKFILKEVFEATLQNISTKEIIGYSNKMKSASLETTLDIVYAMGGRGNVKIGKGFANNRAATITLEDAVWTTDYLGALSGNDVVANVDVPYIDTKVVTDDTTTTEFTAQGDVGEEIECLQTINSAGEVIATLTQVATTIVAGTFTYTAGTKLLTFFADEIEDGSYVRIMYQISTGSGSKTISVTGDGTPDIVFLTLFGVASDLCNTDTFPVVIVGNVQLDGGFTLATSADGDPSVQNLSGEYVQACNSEESLFDLTIYDIDDVS